MRITRVLKEFVFDVAEAPTASVHASTVLKLKDGSVLASWFGGTKEKDSDVRIWVARRTKQGWEKPHQIDSGMEKAHWNPVLFEKKNGEICLYYKVGEEIKDWKTYVASSFDGGKSFSESRELVEGDVGGRGPVKNKPIYLSNGTLLAPASDESTPEWFAFMDLSEDDGETWTKVVIEKPDEPYVKKAATMIQPTLWEQPEGEVHALLRTNRGYAYRTDSKNFGKTWSSAYITTVPNNNSGLDLVKMESGTLALVSNPVPKHGGERTPLTLAFSDDNGLTFERALTLEDSKGEYSYPAIVARGNQLFITYTYQRKTIAYVEVDCVT